MRSASLYSSISYGIKDVTETPTRRRFLQTAGVVGLASLAGCGSDVEGGTGQTTDRDVPPPSVELPEGWEPTSTETEPEILKQGTMAGINYSAVGHTRRYENVRLRSRIREETLERVDRPLFVMFATRIDFFPRFAHIGASRMKSEIDSTVKSEFREQLQEFGVVDTAAHGTVESATAGGPSELFKYTGAYPVEDFTIRDVNIPNVNRSSFTVEGELLPIEGLVATWKDGEHQLAAGGVFPAAPYRPRKTFDITGGVELALNVDLDLRPERYRQTVHDFVASVDAE